MNTQVRESACVYTGNSIELDIGADDKMSAPDLVVTALRKIGLHTKTKEHFYVLLLNGKHRLISYECVSIGTLTTSLVHPREVFRSAVMQGAAAIVVAHNHPSGDPQPSRDDLEVTDRLVRAGKTLGIPVLDHIIIGDERSFSFRSEGRL